MARSRETKIELTAYDGLFETDQSRNEANLSKIRDIPIAEIDEFPDHPFKVLMDEDMEQLANAKTEVQKPFAFEDELKEKTDRLNILNILNIELNLDEKDTSVMDTEPEQTEEQPERRSASRER